MIDILVLQEQSDQSALKLLAAVANLSARPAAELVRQGWNQPLLVLGDGLNSDEGKALLRHAPRSDAPLLLVPPLSVDDVTTWIDAPAPVVVTRQRAEAMEIIDNELRGMLGRTALQVFCTHAVETALKSGVLARANDLPVIWAYQATHVAMPIIWIGAQVLLISARTDPLDREELLTALLSWAAARVRVSQPIEPVGAAPEQSVVANPAVLRAVIVAWSARPDLSIGDMAAWLSKRLQITVQPDDLNVAVQALQQNGAIDAQGQPQADRVAELVREWGLRAWVREARQLEQE